ncbi:MAG: hypothetical protein WC615_04885 [Mucilaginibacter sp.]|jgi:hypothetical protein|uniref:hypothetical protein n=1 Tax=Mucilaginibacter sp. TaxID=1882438 RepID=UPI0035617536
MKYNPITKEIYTDADTFLKKLHCPFSKQWEELSVTDSLKKGKMCDQCQTTVFDTASLSETELQTLVNDQPQTCLKVDINQDNLTITYKQNGK